MAGEWFIEMLFGDRVRTIANERVDQVDFDGLQHLVYGYISEALGAIMGEGAGCLTSPTLTYSNNGTNWFVHVGPFQLYYSFQSRTSSGALLEDTNDRTSGGAAKVKALRGAVLTHDPAEPGQTSTLDVTSWVSAAQTQWDFGTGAFTTVPPLGVMPFLWARPVLVDADSGPRRKWDVATSQEVPITISTRRRVRIEFEVSVTEPTVPDSDLDGVPDEAPWVKIGRFSSWDLDTQYDASSRLGPEKPVLYPRSAWDSDDWFSFTREPGTSNFDGRDFNTGGTDGSLEQFGLPPESFVSDGQIAPSNNAPSGNWGVALYRTHTSGASAFMAPRPPWVPGHGMMNEGSSSGTQGRKEQRPGLGLIGLTHLLRNRIKGHLEGGLTKVSDQPLIGEDWAGSTVDNENRGKHPWWDLPRYGLTKVETLVDSLQTQITLLTTTLTDEVNNRIAGDAAVEAKIGARLIFAVDARLSVGSGTVNYTFDIERSADNSQTSVTPTTSAAGVHQWQVSYVSDGLAASWAVVVPQYNADGSLSNDDPFYSPTVDLTRNCAEIILGANTGTAGTINTGLEWVTTISMFGQDSSGARVPAFCSYKLMVFEGIPS